MINILIVFAILFGLLIFLYNKREVNENYLFLKLIGYFLLGSFRFNLNGFVIPLGFVISIFMKPMDNIKIKKTAAILGLINLIVGVLFIN
jgi:hypothetical protein